MINCPKLHSTNNDSGILRYLKAIALLVTLVASSGVVHAQPRLVFFSDAGATNVSGGSFLKHAMTGSYGFHKNRISVSGQFNVKGNNDKSFSAYMIDATRSFMIREIPFEIQALYIRNMYSELLYEQSMGLIVRHEGNHVDWDLGTSFRRYGFTNMAEDQLDIDPDSKIHENWNLVYHFAYRILPVDHDWNIAAAITNRDQFLIHQETNPMYFIQGTYRFTTPFTAFVQAWYKNAGMFNLSVNPFGYFFRWGIQWNLQ